MYAACPLRKSQNPNKVAICRIQSRFICKGVMQRQEKTFFLPCSCKVGGKWLCSRTYSGITRNRPARLGLLYLFIVGGQCHTRPLMHVAGVLGCCSGSLEPESSCHDRDWIMELPMEADILTFTGIFTPEDASVASCFPFDITISLSWFPLLSIPPLHCAIP